jgi:hypothetical protein
MADLSDGRAISILKWNTRGRGLCRTISQIYEVEKGAKFDAMLYSLKFFDAKL